MYGNAPLRHRRAARALQEMQLDARQIIDPITISTRRLAKVPTTTLIHISIGATDTTTSTTTKETTTKTEDKPSTSSTKSTSSSTTTSSTQTTTLRPKEKPTTTTQPDSVAFIAPSTTSSGATSSSSSDLSNTSGSSSSSSIVGGLLGALAAIIILSVLATILVKRLKRRQESRDEALFFNAEKLERPGMVRGFEAGPGVSSPSPSPWTGSLDNNSRHHYNSLVDSGNMSGNTETGLLMHNNGANPNDQTVFLFPKPPSVNGTISSSRYAAVPPTPPPKPSTAYGTMTETVPPNPFGSPTVPGSLYDIHDTTLGTGAPPIPGTQGGPAPYGIYTNTGTYPSTHHNYGVRQGSLTSNNTTSSPPPQLAAVAGAPPVSITNPFASPSVSRRGSATSSRSAHNRNRSLSSNGHANNNNKAPPAYASPITEQADNADDSDSIFDHPPAAPFSTGHGYEGGGRPGSSHSTMSEAHLGQAVKVQVGAMVVGSPPKYEEVGGREGFVSVDKKGGAQVSEKGNGKATTMAKAGAAGTANNNGTAPPPTPGTGSKSRPHSFVTEYDPDDAYGGM